MAAISDPSPKLKWRSGTKWLGMPLIVVEEGNAVRRATYDELREAAYALLMLVPPGKVTTYGSIARALGVSPRLVGRFMKENDRWPVVPCHRVVGSDGKLVGFSMGGLALKRRLLEAEGVKLERMKVARECIVDVAGGLGLSPRIRARRSRTRRT